MKNLLLFATLAVTSLARPALDIVPSADLNSTLRSWRRTQPLSYLVITNTALAPNYRMGDVAMWEEYHGQTINAGDLFVADYPEKKLFKQVREARAVTDTTITTLLGTTIPLTQVRGVVRRMVRVTP